MLTAVWTVLGILKIAGFVLLGILGLLLTVILLLLFVPIRYQVAGSFYNKPVGMAGVSWLFHLVSVKAVYEEKLVLAVRVLGIRIFGMEKAFGKKAEDGEEPKEGKTDGAGSWNPEENSAGEPEAGGEVSLGGEPVSAGESGALKEPESGKEADVGEELPSFGESETDGEVGQPEELVLPEEPKQKRKTKKGSEKGSKRKKEKKQKKRKQKLSLLGLWTQLKEKLQGIKKQFKEKLQKIRNQWREKLRQLKERFVQLENKKEKLVEFWNDPANRHTLRLLKRQLLALIKHILPGKLSGRVRFGFEDPFTTGQVLTYISPFYGFYAQKVEVIPVFGEKVMEGEGMVKGRIRIGTLIWIGVRMLFDQNFRKLLKKYL